MPHIHAKVRIALVDCLDLPTRPHGLRWKSKDEERATVCTRRRATRFAFEDLTFVVCHFLPHLNRDTVRRIGRAAGLNHRPRIVFNRSAEGQGTFRDYNLSFPDVDIKHLPKLQRADRARHKRYPLVSLICSFRSVHLAVKDGETGKKH
jgi:hypothetical protein